MLRRLEAAIDQTRNTLYHPATRTRSHRDVRYTHLSAGGPLARRRLSGKIEDEKLRNRTPRQKFIDGVVTTIYHILAWALAIGGAIFSYWLYRKIWSAWK